MYTRPYVYLEKKEVLTNKAFKEVLKKVKKSNPKEILAPRIEVPLAFTKGQLTRKQFSFDTHYVLDPTMSSGFMFYNWSNNHRPHLEANMCYLHCIVLKREWSSGEVTYYGSSQVLDYSRIEEAIKLKFLITADEYAEKFGSKLI